MKKLILIIICISICFSFVLSVEAYSLSEMLSPQDTYSVDYLMEPPRTIGFDSEDYFRNFVLASLGIEQDFKAFQDKYSFNVYRVTYPLCKQLAQERIMAVPFVDLKENVNADSFYVEIIYDYNWYGTDRDTMAIRYTVDGVKYWFEYNFVASTNITLKETELRFKLDEYDVYLSQQDNRDDKYIGAIVCQDVLLHIDVITDDVNKINFDVFELGELSLELDSDRTTAATTAVTTETPSSATTPKEEPNNSTGKTAIVIIGSVIIIAVLSVLTIVIMRRRRE